MLFTLPQQVGALTGTLLNYTPFQGVTNAEEKGIVHWSYYVLVLSSAAGAVTAVAAYILAIPAITVAGGILFVSNGVGSHYVRKFSHLKVLQDHVDDMKVENKELKNEIARIKQINKELTQIYKDYQEIPQDWRHQIEKGEEGIKEKAKLIEKLTSQLKKIQHQIDKSIDLTAENALKICSENNRLQGIAEELKNDIEANQHTGERLKDNVTVLGERTDVYDQINDKFTAQVRLLGTLFQVVPKIFNEIQLQVKEFVREADEVEEIVPQATLATEHLEREIKALSEKKEGLEKVVGQFSHQLDEFEKFQKTEKYASYLEYKKTKHSKKFKAFLEFKKKEKHES